MSEWLRLMLVFFVAAVVHTCVGYLLSLCPPPDRADLFARSCYVFAVSSSVSLALIAWFWCLVSAYFWVLALAEELDRE